MLASTPGDLVDLLRGAFNIRARVSLPNAKSVASLSLVRDREDCSGARPLSSRKPVVVGFRLFHTGRQQPDAALSRRSWRETRFCPWVSAGIALAQAGLFEG